MTGTPRHVRKNRRSWDGYSDEYQREHARQLNRFDRPAWGVWGIPESRLKVLGDVRGKDVLEYGCGGGQWSIALARKGARPVGLDVSRNQLRHAARLMGRAGVRFPLVNADAERTPFIDSSFDVVMCDHGAMTFADPYRTVPEVARILRPAGLFAFSHQSAFHFVCWSDPMARVDDRLSRNYFEMRKWSDDDGVEFMLPYGEWIRLFRSCGFQIEDLIEPRPSPRARTTYGEFAPREWARRFPGESIWKLRRSRA